jgi:hypothetical protein
VTRGRIQRDVTRGGLVALVLLASAPAYAVTVDLTSSDLAGNEVINTEFSGPGLLAFDVHLNNQSAFTIVVQVQASEVSNETVAFNSLVFNKSSADLSRLDLSLEAPASFGTVGTVLDTSGSAIAGVITTASSAAIPLDPPFAPIPGSYIEIGNVGLGDEPPGTTNWAIDVSGLPPGGATFTMHLAAVPEPAACGNAALAVLITLRLCGRRVGTSRRG